MQFHFDWTLETRLVTFEAATQAPVKLRVARFPKLIANMHTSKINIAPAKSKNDRSGTSDFGFRISDFVNPPALFWLLRMAGVEDHAIAQLQRGFEINRDALVVEARYCAEVNAAFFAKAGVNQFLVIRAFKPARVKAAGERHLHFVLWICGREVAADVRRRTVG